MGILQSLIDGFDEHHTGMATFNSETAASTSTATPTFNSETAAPTFNSETAALTSTATVVVDVENFDFPSVITSGNNSHTVVNHKNDSQNGANDNDKNSRFPILSTILPIGVTSSISISELSMSVAVRLQSTLRHLDESHQSVLSCIINLMIKYW